ncbi:MAG: hypothetical protein M1348_01450 [Candidatus Parvarchaeota archaeon]|jgi:vacuolar-type H+-ATPase subunit H|nr:hypothetical protein [Candidatus Parvarchaeota archaeon]
MADILDELAKIKAAERAADKMIFETERKVDKMIDLAKNDRTHLFSEAESELLIYKEKTQKTYAGMTELMLTKLRKDYEHSIDTVNRLPVKKITTTYVPEILKIIKSYGDTVFQEIK